MPKQTLKMMEARNKFNNKDEEVVLGEYKRSFLGYMLNLLFGVESLKYLLFVIVAGLIYLSELAINKKIETNSVIFYIAVAILGFAAFCWLCRLVVGLAEWRYKKYLIITNQGIWFMLTSRFWSAKNWKGQKTFLGPRWNFYSWDELDNIEVFTDHIARMCKLKNLKLYRFDGAEKLYYFSAREVDDILAYSRERYTPKKRNNATNSKNLSRQIKLFVAIRRFFSGDNDEI